MCKRASRSGALFVCLLFCAALASVPVVAAAQSCVAGTLDESVTVERVVDGDTLRLRDGRSVRLIGINSPELGRKGRPPEPLAKTARDSLRKLLGKNARVGLVYGGEKHDRYGRLLAHVYLSNGKSVEAYLLRAGLAAQIVVPPNVRNAACYRASEQVARRGRIGVWGNIYRPVAVEKLSRNARGFRIFRGRVQRIGESKRSVWLNFPRRPGEGRREGVAVRVAREDLQYFKDWQPQSLQGKTITVRGWVSKYKKQLVLRVRHPANVEVEHR